MRFVRYALFGLGGLLLVLVAALVIVVLTFDPNAHKGQLQKLVHDQTGRELTLTGDLKLKLFPWLALEVGRASLGNAPGFGAAPMVEFERARLGVKLLPLLHKKLEIGAVSLEAPTIRLSVDAAGHNNWSDLGGKDKGKDQPADTGEATAISVAKLQIVNGTLQYIDRSADSELAVQQLNLETGSMSAGQPFDLKLSGTLKKGKTLDAALDLKARARFDLEASRYHFDAPAIGLVLKGTSLPAAGMPVELHFAAIDADLKAQTLDMPGMELRIRGSGPLSGTLSGAVSGKQIVDALKLHVVSPVASLQLRGDGLPAAGLPVEARFASIDIDLDAQTLKLPGMDLRLAGATLSGALSGAKIIDAPRFTGPVQFAAASSRELLKTLGVELPVTRDPGAFKRLEAKGTLSAGSNDAMLSDLTLRFDNTSASGRAGISNFSTSALAFDLKLDRLNADRYLPPEPPKSAAKAAPSPSAPTPIPVELIRSLNVHGNLAVGTAVFAGIQYSALHIGLNAEGGRLRVFPSEAQMYGGQYRGDINVDASGKLPRVSFDEHVTGVDFAPLFQDLFETKRFSGRGNAAIKASGSGADTVALLRTLTGTLEFHVDNGAFEGTDLWYEIRRARALLHKQDIPARTGPERTVFKAVAATGRITNGVVSNDDLLAALQYLQVKGHGSADIADGTLDYHLDAAVLKIPDDGSDAADMKDVVGLQVPVLVTGSFAAPKVRPDLAGLVKARVQQEIDKRKDDVKQKLQEKLQDKLKDLFGN